MHDTPYFYHLNVSKPRISKYTYIFKNRIGIIMCKCLILIPSNTNFVYFSCYYNFMCNRCHNLCKTTSPSKIKIDPTLQPKVTMNITMYVCLVSTPLATKLGSQHMAYASLKLDITAQNPQPGPTYEALDVYQN